MMYTCNKCEIGPFPKVSSVKRHQTRKHKGETGLVVVEIDSGASVAPTEVKATHGTKIKEQTVETPIATERKVPATARKSKAREIVNSVRPPVILKDDVIIMSAKVFSNLLSKMTAVNAKRSS